ncbi:hypothetical protein NDU88_007804 [Pleurodeles waltl]|uniref:Uncharacterized protein n=1 Tax=Pleurodeles waltl TaxID=8319 RepID=A0AAV7NXB5_PLEWA|nr:hypothetical protein NDU88_007804 [Pleurodeles waltl]
MLIRYAKHSLARNGASAPRDQSSSSEEPTMLQEMQQRSTRDHPPTHGNSNFSDISLMAGMDKEEKGDTIVNLSEESQQGGHSVCSTTVYIEPQDSIWVEKMVNLSSVVMSSAVCLPEDLTRGSEDSGNMWTNAVENGKLLERREKVQVDLSAPP